MTSTAQLSKSFVLRVARLAPRERAIAAIIASNWLIGLPAVRRAAAISAYTSAASLSKLKTRSAKSASKIFLAASHSTRRRFHNMLFLLIFIATKCCRPPTRKLGASPQSSSFIARTFAARVSNAKGLVSMSMPASRNSPRTIAPSA
jgi:hypothetical protein